MSLLMRSSEISKRPVVTFAGEDVAQIKDIVYGAGGGHVDGFSLAGRGLFAGPLKTVLPWRSVVGLGPDAVIINDQSALVPLEALTDGKSGIGHAGHSDILGSRVLTDDGVDLGKVVDVVIQVDDNDAPNADVVGYEVEPSEALGSTAHRVLIPLPDTLAASGEHLMVPAAARNFVSHDLAGFGAAVTAFRQQLEGNR